MYKIELRQVFQQTGPMNCWFYAAKTIVYHRTGRLLNAADYMGSAPAPAFPVQVGRGAGAPSWLAHGLPPAEVGAFAELFGFDRPSFQPAVWTEADLTQILSQCGPLWFGGMNGRFRHAVVVCGIANDGTVYYGNPASGRTETATLGDFNAWKTQLIELPNPLYFP